MWNEADPLWHLDQLLASQDSEDQALRLPRTLIVHGACDSVVPIEHSRRWIATLQARDPNRHTLVAVPSARHTYEIFPCYTVEAVFDGVVAWLAAGTPQSSAV
uniref:Peptidase S9 prolyl oligopeptidase catalytic domain-containing protein n=1 Tax=Alexandrium catenella TaxID=2925 RepID=A0A7S1LZW0_ALECA|mmetsp:Transcript_17185/g.46627  ORF Transcript_17185/g.46627 Transcript_17185/m.46627 type:complete len:103 (+) Transcript_17185:1-309(+)